MVLVQKWPFFRHFFFQAIQVSKMSFTIFQNEKTPFQAIKTRSSKLRKIDIFPNELTHGFGPKLAILAAFFFRQYRPEKCLLTIFYNEKPPFQAIKTRSSKHISWVNPWFWSKKWPFFQPFCFQAIQARENVFYDILKPKKRLSSL